MTTIAFKLDYETKLRLMRDCMQKDLNMSLVLRRMVQLYLTDEKVRKKVMDFERKDGWEGEF